MVVKIWHASKIQPHHLNLKSESMLVDLIEAKGQERSNTLGSSYIKALKK